MKIIIIMMMIKEKNPMHYAGPTAICVSAHEEPLVCFVYHVYMQYM